MRVWSSGEKDRLTGNGSLGMGVFPVVLFQPQLQPSHPPNHRCAMAAALAAMAAAYSLAAAGAAPLAPDDQGIFSVASFGVRPTLSLCHSTRDRSTTNRRPGTVLDDPRSLPHPHPPAVHTGTCTDVPGTGPEPPVLSLLGLKDGASRLLHFSPSAHSGPRAVMGCSGLAQVTLPLGLTQLGHDAWCTPCRS